MASKDRTTPRKKRKSSSKSKLKYEVAVVLVVSCVLVYAFLNSKNQIGSSAPKAAIVDQLSDSSPNQTFVQTATSLLNKAGFSVYYYSQAAIDVTFYRTLPSRGFGLIILRVHSALNEESSYLVLFTTEPFDNDKASSTYLQDFLSDPPRLVRARITEDSDPYFGITPSFVSSMNGEFNGAMIIMMGCSGLDPVHTSMADALIKKGARVCTGLDGLVSPPYTDDVTTRLLEKMLVENETVGTAVAEINSEVGPDPTYNSKLSSYPSQQGDYRLKAT